MITINCDMGEGYSIYSFGADAELMPYVDLANVACGFHASDFGHMRETVRLAARHGVKIGAHPSLPDRQGFGRREMRMGREELANCMIYQIGALEGFLKAEGLKLNHIKPHGALYGMSVQSPEVAEAVCDAADVFEVPILGMAGTVHETIYPARGHTMIAEYYPDMDYTDDGGAIMPRHHVARDADLAVQACLRAVDEGLTNTITGNDLKVRADSICIHSDNPSAVALASALRAALDHRRLTN